MSDAGLAGQLARLDPASVERLLTELRDRESGRATKLASPESAQRLKDLGDQLVMDNTLQRGDLVQWKPGLKNRTVPLYGVPAYVVEVCDPPIVSDSQSTGSAYFREPLTLVLGVLDEDDELNLFHFDGRRFERFRLD